MTLVSIDINVRMNVYSKEKYFPLGLRLILVPTIIK